MKKAKWIVLIVLGVAAFVTLAVYLNDIKAKIYTGKLKGFTLEKGQSPENSANAGVTGFVSLKESAIDFLLKNMENEDPGIRLGSMVALGKISPSIDGGKFLLKLLADPKEPEDQVLVWALVKHKELIGKDVAKILAGTKNKKTKIYCAQFFAKAGNGSGKALAELLGDEDLDVVTAACEALQSVKYPAATPGLISAAKKMAKANNSKGLEVACSAIPLNVSPDQAEAVLAELGSDEIPELLEACRIYAKSLPEGNLVVFCRDALTSENKVLRKSAMFVMDSILPAAKANVALAILKDKNVDSVIFALDLLRQHGGISSLQKVAELVESDDVEVAKAAIAALAGMIDRNKYGYIPTYGGYKVANEREPYIELLLRKIEETDLRFTCAEALTLICDPQPPLNPSPEEWQAWWNDFKNTRGLIVELVNSMETVKDLLKDKTRENMTKAKEILDKADVICTKLEEISSSNTKIASWVTKKRDELNQLRYTVNKSKPLDVMN
ncbi:MAG: hypothetical protein Kow00107_06830 [Planctomycetota bacterium]